MKRSSLEYISAQDAARLLGVRLPTIYSYVTRGWLRSVSGSHGRARRYSLDDVQRLKARHDARSGHSAVAAGALRWGDPVLETSIADICEDGPRYRGHNAVELSRSGYAFEAIADLLWGAALRRDTVWETIPEPPVVGDSTPSIAPPSASLAHPISSMLRRLTGSLAIDAVTPLAEARSLTMSCAMAMFSKHTYAPSSGDRRVATVLNDAFGGRGGERASEAIDSALILCAEHDLNASALVARTAASAGASLRMSVIAALATLSGERHGGLCDVVERWVGSLATPADARESVRRRAQLGQSIPGFDHPLYPQGDPRGKALIDLAVSLNRPSLALEICWTLIDEVNESAGLFPSLDMGLVTLAIALDAPPHAAIALFAVGRTAGWLAHALEQRNAAYLLRPRSRYTGDPERRD